MTKILTEHTHHKPLELAVFTIPADERKPMGIRLVRPDWGPMQRLVGGGYLQVLRPNPMISLRCGCETRLVVNEEAAVPGREFMPNPRATQLIDLTKVMVGVGGIRGDVFLAGHGPIEREGFPDPDFISLPQEFNRWKGPGHKIPKPPKVLRVAEKNKR